MISETAGYMDINISHNLSRRMMRRRFESSNDFERDHDLASKVEMMYNIARGV